MLWTAKIIESQPGDGAAGQPARLRIVRQLVANAKALEAVASALELLPQVRIDDKDITVSYVASRTRRPALADGQ